MSAAPARRTEAAASAAIEPAPTMQTRAPSSGPIAAAASLERDGDDRLAGPVDVGLGVGALADPQALLEQAC